MQVAERLFAERVIAAVSIREIGVVAGHRNNSAVTYHFGSRQGLVDAIWDRHSRPVNEARARMLDQLRAEHRLGDIEALVDAWVTPLVEEVSRHEPSYWARFNEQQLATMPLPFLDRFDSDLGARDDDPPLLVLAALFRRMAKTLTQLPGRQRPERVALTVRFFITGMASWERDAQAGRVVPGSLQSAAATLRDLAMALLAAPPQSGRRTQRG